VNEVYGLLRDGHGPSEGPVEAAAGNGGFPAVGGLVHPGSATVESGLGIGHECPTYVSEAVALDKIWFGATISWSHDFGGKEEASE